MRLSPGLAARPPQTAATVPPPSEAVAAPPATYLEQYALAKRPFVDSAEHFQLLNTQRVVLDALVSGMLRDDGHLVLVGEEAVGKTTLLDMASHLLARQDRRILRYNRVRPGPITRADLLQGLSSHDPAPETKPDETLPPAALRFPRSPGGHQVLVIIDDAQVLTPDALDWIVETGGAEGRDHPRFVLAGSLHLRSMLRDASRAPFTSAVAAFLQINRLTPWEARQYIEHHLWLAGSSTRKLITQSALRDIIRHADGRPGEINTLLEGALATGFLRGDPRITPKTIRAVTGRAAGGRRSQVDGERVVTLIAVFILLIGAGSFAYRALTDAPREAPPPAPPVAAGPPHDSPSPPPAKAQVPVTPPAPSGPLSADTGASLVQSGDARLAAGDISAARLLYQRAAQAGNGPAATAIAKTFDPNILGRRALKDIEPNPSLALFWYRKAIALGDRSAEPLLRNLQARPDQAR